MRSAAAVAAALVATAAPAEAIPPYAVTGRGFVAPYFGLNPADYAFAFRGTATDALGSSYPCEFAGNVLGTMTGAAGAASGVCGGVTYPLCATTLSVARWDLACTTGGAGSFVVTFDPGMTTFDATGVTF